MCSAPSMPAVKDAPVTPPPPTAVDPAVLAARQNTQAAAAMAQGRASTILTSPTGDLDTSNDSRKKTLLGA